MTTAQPDPGGHHEGEADVRAGWPTSGQSSIAGKHGCGSSFPQETPTQNRKLPKFMPSSQTQEFITNLMNAECGKAAIGPK